MYIESGGTLIAKGVTFTGSWSGDSVPWSAASILGERWGTYSEIYRSQIWVSTLVNKLAKAQARLPLPVYTRDDDGGRSAVRDHLYARLLRSPSTKHDAFSFYAWTVSTLEVYGSMAWGKIRDAGGRPVELVLLHPAGLVRKTVDGETYWTFSNSRVVIERIPDCDVVHFHTYNPDDPSMGLSPLEPLRATLENEDYARRATSSFWRNGARPGVALSHPGNLSKDAQDRLKVQWNAVAGGADRTGSTVVLEEGMKPEIMQLSAEESQYIETRKLNRDEVCAAYDVPPPVVHILDRATFSNVTEQMRSMYRDTMGPRLGAFESAIEFGLRASVRDGASEPDFGDDVYAEFLLDEVLRGDFEVQTDAIQKAIFSGQMTPNEGRKLRNMAAVLGGDQLYINQTMAPLKPPPVEDPNAPKPDRAVDVALNLITNAPSLVQAPGLPVLVEQLRAVLEGKPMAPVAPAAAPAVAPPAFAPPRAISPEVGRKVMGRLSRPTAPMDVDVKALADGLGDDTAAVLVALVASQAAGESMPELRARIAAMTTKENP